MKMGRFIVIGMAEHPLIPYRWQPRTAPYRFIATPTAMRIQAPLIIEEMMVEDEPTPTPLAVETAPDMSMPITEDAPTPIMEAVFIPDVAEDVVEAVSETVEAPETLVEALPTPAEEEALAAMEEPVEAPEEAATTPLSLNLLNIRRHLALTPEEFARPIIEDGEGLINRLEAGFSRASAEVARLICEAWSINQKYLFSGAGPMFQIDKPGQNYCQGLVTLLKQYLQVATFDRKGHQYWKGSLVDDMFRLIDTTRLTGSEAARIIRVMYDFLDAEQFEDLLERMGRAAL